MADGSRPRVLLVNHTARLGGNELGVGRLIPLLLDEFDVIALLFEDGDFADSLRRSGVEVHVRPLHGPVMRSDRAAAARPGTALRLAPATVSYAAALTPWLRRRQIDLLWANTFKAMAIATPAAKLLGIPVLWHLHDRVADDYLPRRIVGPMRAAFRTVPDAVVANSRATATTAGRGMTPTVVHPGLVPEKVRLRDGLPDGPPVIGMIGRISPTKGQHVLIRALPDVLRVHPDARVRIVGSAMFGEEGYEAETRSEARRLGVDHAISWVGRVSDTRSELDRLTVAVHAATVPEPFGQVITEALARCVPLIATRGGGATEIVEPAGGSPRGRLITPGAVGELRDALLHTLDDPAAAQKRATRAQPEVVAAYSIDRAANAMRTVWRQLLGGPAPVASTRSLRFAWVTNYDFTHEFADVAGGRTPSHRLLGAAELMRSGHDVLQHTLPARSALPLPPSIRWRVSQALWIHHHRKSIDVVVATHEAASVPTLLLKRLGVLRVPVLVMTVAAVPAVAPSRGVRGRVVRAALRGADVLTTFASVQVEELTKALDCDAEKVRFMPLGVDCEYFTAAAHHGRNHSIAAVGTNTGKDFTTFARALPDGLDCTIVTDARNEAIARRHLKNRQVEFRSNVPIAELREVYRNCGVMVIPLRDADYSSGQTVLLENLAMNTPLIVSDVTGVADYVGPDIATCVEPGDIAQLRSAMLADWRPVDTRSHVLARFTVQHMAAQLEAIARELSRD